MRSNYKQLGQYIRQVDVRNVEGKEDNLLGVSVQKTFIPSIANTVGTDFTKYKVVKKGQFTYIPDTSRRGDKIGIALLTDYDEGLVSNVYTVFEIIDEHQLIPEYLMLWFSRPEFDRYARFKSHGSVREVMDWDEMCKVELPVPSYEEQLEIVNSYRTISERIALKQKINDNLFSSATAALREIYSDESNLGEAVTLDSYCSQIVSGGTPSRTVDSFWTPATIPWLKNGEVKNNIIISTEECISEEGLAGSSARVVPKYTVNMAMYCVSDIQVSLSCIPLSTNQAVLNLSTDSFRKACFLYYLLTAFGNDITSQANGSAQQNLSKEKIASFVFRSPKLEKQAFDFLETSMRYRIMLTKEISVLLDLQSSMLSLLNR